MSADPDSAEVRVLALLDTLIPPAHDMPGAGSERVATQVIADASGGPLGAALDTVLAALPADFAEADTATRESALRIIANADSAAVAGVVNLVYTAYYSDLDVLRSLERVTGYRADPPQPRGYTLEPFDSHLVAAARSRSTTWRVTS